MPCLKTVNDHVYEIHNIDEITGPVRSMIAS